MAGIALVMAGLFAYLYASARIEVLPDDQKAVRLIESEFGAATEVIAATPSGFTLKVPNNGRCGTGAIYTVTYTFTGSRLTRLRVPCDTTAIVLAPVTKYSVTYLDANDNPTTSAPAIRALIVRLARPTETLTLVMRGPNL
ncbi:MAG TPA: hypothetical protein VGT02_05695 [Methylomirabilota bacterium]|nr:hypothetical protein [Methylomirabilota bacterium]